jgi:hypothetical protein
MIFLWLEDTPTEEILFQAMTGFVSFAVIGFILTFAHSRIVKSKARGESEQDFDVHQQRTITLRLPYDKAFDICKESLKAVNGSVKEMKLSAGKIEARTGWTWKAFGCVISYVVKPIGEQLTEVEVLSRPRVRTTLVDYGENLDNVDKICAFLSKRDNQLDINLLSAKLNQLSEAQTNRADQFKAATTKPKEHV